MYYIVYFKWHRMIEGRDVCISSGQPLSLLRTVPTFWSSAPSTTPSTVMIIEAIVARHTRKLDHSSAINFQSQ
jgi:hypothetical protein